MNDNLKRFLVGFLRWFLKQKGGKIATIVARWGNWLMMSRGFDSEENRKVKRFVDENLFKTKKNKLIFLKKSSIETENSSDRKNAEFHKKSKNRAQKIETT